MTKRLSFASLALVAVLSFMAMTAHRTLADERDFTLINNSSVVLARVYVSPADVDDWQEDVLGQDVLNPGDSVNIHFSPNDGSDTCLYDIRVDGQGGEQGVLYKIDLCSTGTVTFSDSN